MSVTDTVSSVTRCVTVHVHKNQIASRRRVVRLSLTEMHRSQLQALNLTDPTEILSLRNHRIPLRIFPMAALRRLLPRAHGTQPTASTYSGRVHDTPTDRRRTPSPARATDSDTTKQAEDATVAIYWQSVSAFAGVTPDVRPVPHSDHLRSPAPAAPRASARSAGRCALG
jgi:hypothetical protein